nr:MAG TPA: hypothetical protein [Bacteriophage sp.]
MRFSKNPVLKFRQKNAQKDVYLKITAKKICPSPPSSRPMPPRLRRRSRNRGRVER